MKNTKSNYNRKHKKQLCWDCKNACGGCVWARYGVPVPGWIATKNYIPENGEHAHTYHVYSCPLFQPDRKK